MELTARIGSVLTLMHEENPTLNVSKLQNRFRYPNPAYRKALALGLAVFGIPKDIVLVEARADRCFLPRGLLRDLISTWPTTLIDQTLTAPAALPSATIEPRSYQGAALDDMMTMNQGLLVCPTGGGKTAMGVALVAKRQQKALILVHTKDLLGQWVDSFKRFCGIECGTIQAGVVDVQDVTVAMMQSIPQPMPPELWGHFGLVLADEVHHSPCSTVQAILDQLPAKFRYGVTATPYRADELTFLIHALIGTTIHEIGMGALLSAGAIIKPRVYAVKLSSYLPTYDGYNGMMAALIADEDRNRAILDYVEREASLGHSCLVLSGRVDHATALFAGYRGEGGVLAHGGTPKAERAAAIKDMRDGSKRVLFATKIADEGLDVPRLSRLFLTTPSRHHGKIIQQLGRITRPFEGKKDAAVFDFVDELIPLAWSQYRSRRQKVYACYETREISSCPTLMQL